MSGVETLLTNIIVYNILLKLIVTLTMLFTNIGLAALHFNINFFIWDYFEIGHCIALVHILR